MSFQLPADAAPSADQRVWLERRYVRLDDFLRPASAAEIHAELAAMLAVLAAKGLSDVGQEAFQAVYADTLSGLPYVGLCAVCAAYRKGERGDRKWAPNAAELRQAVLAEMRKWQAERLTVKRILSAKILPIVEVSPERREEIAAKAAAAVSEAAAKARLRDFERNATAPNDQSLELANPLDEMPTAEKTRLAAEAALARFAAEPPPKILLSASALGLSPEAYALVLQSRGLAGKVESEAAR